MSDRACRLPLRTALFASVATLLALSVGCGDDVGGDPDDDNGTDTDGPSTSQGPGSATESTTGPTSSTGSTTVNPTATGPTDPTDPTDPTETGTDTDTGGEEQGDRVVMRTGEFVGDGEVGRIMSWGIAEQGLVNAEITWVEDRAVQGDALVRWHEDDDTLEALASPEDLVDTFGTSQLETTTFDATGFIAFQNESSCVGMWADGLDEKICASDPELEPGGFLSLDGLSNGKALVTVRRNSPDNPRFEFYGVDAIDPRVRYSFRGDSVDNVQWEEIDFARNGVIMPSGGVLMQVAGSTPEGRAADGLLMSEAEGTAEVVTHLYSQGAEGYTGVFPGAPTFPPELLPNNGVVFRALTMNDMGVVGFTYTPTEPDGTLVDNAGIYSVVPGETEFRLHHSFDDELFTENGLSQVEVQGTTPATPAISFGLTRDRMLVMSARLRDGGAGIYREIARGEIIDLASTGAPAPDDVGVPMKGVTYADIGSVVIAHDGSLMYTARIEGRGIEAPFFGLGVWGVGPSDGFEPEPRLLAKMGDPLPSEDGAEVLEIRIADLLLPDQTGSLGLGLNRSLESSFNFPAFGLQAHGTSGSSPTIRPGECADGLVQLSDGDTDVLMRKELDPACIPEP